MEAIAWLIVILLCAAVIIPMLAVLIGVLYVIASTIAGVLVALFGRKTE